ncbi:hypothetical protein D1AOALGA4SA_4719 [Olavius algarvensis Delta 1 endosymbiont]|nr:hypothetical protein D1AOALGA4SA_4719 [Olavius algarvensis Delta 1 endosymbiont]
MKHKMKVNIDVSINRQFWIDPLDSKQISVFRLSRKLK